MCSPITCITGGRPFGQDGCQVPVGKGICGEKRTLEFINEFKKLFAQKMEEIDAQGGGDCMQEKLRLQQEWIENLIEQNEMLVRAVGELEVEATERVHMLEEKLQRSAQCICEVMNKYRQYDVTSEILTEPLEKIFRLESDQKNLLEFIRRIREDRKWDFEGLSFFEISYRDLFGNDLIENYDKNRCLNNNDEKEEEVVRKQESTIEELRKQIDHFNSFGNVEIISKDLKCKIEECESLRKSMIDMRQALTEEVASKHDTILQLKRDIHRLEEKCIQSDQQTAFKDELVKELRKEIKQLKQQISLPEKPFKPDPIPKEPAAKADTCIFINHSKKVIQSGKSTVIYLTHNDERVKCTSKIYEVHSTPCSKCKQKIESSCLTSNETDNKAVTILENRTTQSFSGNEIEELSPTTDRKKPKRTCDKNNLNNVFDEQKSWPICKSENDLTNCGEETKAVKERSKFTTSTFTRGKTFVGRNSDFVNTDESKCKKRIVSIPNHIPVRTYVNNIECNKNKTF